MVIATLLIATLGQLPETEFSKGSPQLFQKMAKLEIDKGRLVVRLTSGAQDRTGLRVTGVNLFPGVSRVSVRVNGSSTSTSRGGSNGSVRIDLQASSNKVTYAIDGTGGTEKVLVDQKSLGQLKLEIKSGKTSIALEQTAKACTLRIKSGSVRINATGKDLEAIFQSHPLEAREHLFAAIEHYLGKPPFMPLSTAPPGKTLVHLRDGARIVGEIQLEALAIETTYGVLSIPRGELFHVFFPGSAAAAGNKASDAQIVTPRFTPKGKIALENVTLSTPYGELKISTAEILHIAFGPPKDPSPSKDNDAVGP